jgi:hypothetical protein
MRLKASKHVESIATPKILVILQPLLGFDREIRKIRVEYGKKNAIRYLFDIGLITERLQDTLRRYDFNYVISSGLRYNNAISSSGWWPIAHHGISKCSHRAA